MTTTVYLKSSDVLTTAVLFTDGAIGLPRAYQDYTPYGAPLPLTILTSNIVTGAAFTPGGQQHPATGAVYSYPTLTLDLADELPARLTGELLFDQGLYLWDRPAGQPRLFEIVARPHPYQLVVAAGAGEIAAGAVFHVVRGDSPRFGLKDVAADVRPPVLVNGVPVTPMLLADTIDRDFDPVNGTIDASIIGARLAPNSRFPAETFEIVAYGVDAASGGRALLYVRCLEDPARFRRSRDMAGFLGLRPRRREGEPPGAPAVGDGSGRGALPRARDKSRERE